MTLGERLKKLGDDRGILMDIPMKEGTLRKVYRLK